MKQKKTKRPSLKDLSPEAAASIMKFMSFSKRLGESKTKSSHKGNPKK